MVGRSRRHEGRHLIEGEIEWRGETFMKKESLQKRERMADKERKLIGRNER
jgi:hypothetical protein